MALFGLFIIMRLHWGLRVLAAIVFVGICLLMILGAVLTVVDRFKQRSDVEPQFLQHLAERSQAARQQIGRLRAEAAEIEKSCQELIGLTHDPQQEPGESGASHKRKLLLQGYQQELSLRQAKLEFYSRSLQTLEELDKKWRIERRLNELQRDLGRLKSDSTRKDSLEMKQLRAELKSEENLLASYQELTKRLDRSESLENTRELRRELDILLRS
jgi:hypothetical protein